MIGYFYIINITKVKLACDGGDFNSLIAQSLACTIEESVRRYIWVGEQVHNMDCLLGARTSTWCLWVSCAFFISLFSLDHLVFFWWFFRWFHRYFRGQSLQDYCMVANTLWEIEFRRLKKVLFVLEQNSFKEVIFELWLVSYLIVSGISLIYC